MHGHGRGLTPQPGPIHPSPGTLAALAMVKKSTLTEGRPTDMIQRGYGKEQFIPQISKKHLGLLNSLEPSLWAAARSGLESLVSECTESITSPSLLVSLLLSLFLLGY